MGVVSRRPRSIYNTYKCFNANGKLQSIPELSGIDSLHTSTPRWKITEWVLWNPEMEKYIWHYGRSFELVTPEGIALNSFADG